MLPDPRTPFGFGRFAVDLPAGARLRGRQESLAHLPLQAAELAPGETLQVILDRIVNDRRALPPPPGRPSVIRSARMILPDMGSVIHHDDPDTPESIAMEAVRVAGGTAFTLRGGNTEDRADALEEAAARIGAALVPTLAPNPPEPGFAVSRGVAAMEMHWQESAEAVFDLPDGATLALRSHSNADNIPRSLLQKQSIVAPELVRMGIPAAALRAGPRVLADLPGEELVLRAPSSAMLQWEYAGERRSGERPQVSIRMEIGAGAEIAAALAAWDALLASFRRRRSA